PSVSSNAITNIRYVGVMLDQGSVTVASNTINGGNTGIAIIVYDGQTAAASGAANGNTIKNTADEAVALFDNLDPSEITPTAAITKNVIDSSNAYGAHNTSPTFLLNATQNWWGTNSGPSDWSIGTGVGVGPNVDFFPWAVTPTVSGFASCTHTGSGTFTDTGSAVLCGTGANDFIQESGTGPALL